MNGFLRLLADIWPYLAASLTIVLAGLAVGHVVLYKRDSRAAVAWAGLILLAPVLGAVLYLLFGINRVRRRAAGGRRLRMGATGEFRLPAPPEGLSIVPSQPDNLRALARLVERASGRPLLPGNRIAPLVSGDAAYPAMVQAIREARRTVALSTYIFDHDRAGRLFADALEAAVARGVEVRVLVDAVGARYSFPSMVHSLHQRGIPVARFDPTLLPWRMPYMNLRNHRKLMVVDGRVGFAGGMNIREGCLLQIEPRHPIQDLHFRIEGPVVTHLMLAFAEDWLFTHGEVLAGTGWYPDLEPCGSILARGIMDGPDEDFDKARHTLLGALACARDTVRIITPYFLPDAALVSALGIAAMRGVRVEIVLPEKNNLALVQWASTAQLWQVLEHGCRLFYSRPPFDHTKLMIVDDSWCLIGSSNWDARSLRLNFEFDIECYDRTFATDMVELVEQRIRKGRPVTLAELDARSLFIRLRDGLARLAAPYL